MQNLDGRGGISCSSPPPSSFPFPPVFLNVFISIIIIIIIIIVFVVVVVVVVVVILLFFNLFFYGYGSNGFMVWSLCKTYSHLI